MIKSYWLRILFCGIAAAILGFLIGVVTPKQYDAQLQVLVAPFQPTMGGQLDPAEDSVRDILQTSAPRSVATQVEMLTSFGVIKDAAEKVAAERGKTTTGESDELNPINLQDKISIAAAKESDIVTLRVRLSQPDLAQLMANEMYIAFDDKNTRQSQDSANRAIQFLTSQNKEIQKQLDAISSASATARQEAGSPNIDQQIIALITQEKDYETQLQAARAEQVAASARDAFLRGEMKDVPRTISGGTSQAESPEYTKLLSMRAEAIAQRSQLLGRYFPDSELIKEYDTEISALDSRIAKTERYSPNVKSSTSPNPTFTSLQQELYIADANARGSEQRVASLQAAVDGLNQKMAKLPAIQQKLNDLDRKKAVLERISEIYTSKLETLRVAGSSRRSATQLVTSAFGNPRPAVPNFGLNVGLGLFLGLAVGFLWAIGTEAKRNPIRSLGQLNRLSIQPCYRVIPELRSPLRGLNRPPAEVFDSLLVNFVRSEKKGYRLGVVGVTKSAGATTAAINLAIAAARGGYSVLFVEAEGGNNAASKLSGPGDSNFGPGGSIAIYSGHLETPGSGPNGLTAASQGKDLIVYDFPPVKNTGDAFLHANQLDEVVLLVRANLTKSVDFLQAQQALADAGCPLVSVTLSRAQDQSDDISALEQQSDIRSITPQA